MHPSELTDRLVCLLAYWVDTAGSSGAGSIRRSGPSMIVFWDVLGRATWAGGDTARIIFDIR